MNSYFYLTLLSLASVLMSSCSQDAVPAPDNPANANRITFKVSLDTGISSRATDSDETPVRCIMEVYDKINENRIGTQKSASGPGPYSFTATDLEKSKEYVFVFWADGGDDAYVSDNLTSIIARKGGIAFTGSISASASDKVQAVQLSHAVARLSLSNDGDALSVGDKVTVTIPQKTYTMNALKKSLTTINEAGNTELSVTVDNAIVSGEILNRYILVPGDGIRDDNNNTSVLIGSLKIAYQPAGGSKSFEKTIANVPLKANFRTLLRGDIKAIALGGQSFSVSVNNNWSEEVLNIGNGTGTGTTGPGETEDPGDTNDPGNSDPGKPGPGQETPVDPIGPSTPATPSGSTIALTSAGSLTGGMISSALGSGNTLAITGPMDDSDFATLRSGISSHQSVNLDLSGASFPSMPEKAFNGIGSLVSVSLPNTLGEIPDDAFYQCANLSSVDIPSSVCTLGAYAFNSTALKDVSATGVTSLREGAFRNCPDLESAAFGNLKTISRNMFSDCPKLKSVDFSKCTEAVAEAGNFFDNDWNITIFVANEDLASAFKNKWDKTYKISWIVRE